MNNLFGTDTAKSNDLSTPKMNNNVEYCSSSNNSSLSTSSTIGLKESLSNYSNSLDKIGASINSENEQYPKDNRINYNNLYENENDNDNDNYFKNTKEKVPYPILKKSSLES